MHTTPADTPVDEDDPLNCSLNRVLRTVTRTVYPELDLDLSHNATYDQPEFLDLLTHISLTGAFANSGAKTRQLRDGDSASLRSDRRSGLAKQLGWQLRTLDRAQIQSQFDAVFDQIRSLATQARLFSGKVSLAIDEHDWLFYGDAETEMVTHTNPDRGTDLAFTFLTACVVSRECRLTVSVVPLGPDTDIGQAIIQLLGPLTDWLDIHRVYLDRGFYEVRVLQALEAVDLDYVVRARQFPSLAEGPVATTVEEDYEMGGSRPPYETVTLTRVAVPHAHTPAKQTYFVTNVDVTESTASGLADQYRRRWGIETSYRVIGDFLAKTTSKSYSVRLFYFLFAVTLYNLWVLVNALVTVVIEVNMDRPVITSRVFGWVLDTHWPPPVPPPD